MIEHSIIDIGNTVLCDLCSTDYTLDSQTSGGFLFGSKAVCPKCAPAFEAEVKKCGEEEYIKSRCPQDLSFRDWCLKLRGGDNRIIISSF